MAKLASEPFDFPRFESFSDPKEYLNAQNEVYKKLTDVSAQIDFDNPESSLKGALLRFHRGDGYAFYIVTKDQPLTIAHVPCDDAWSVEPALIRGLNRADVIEQLRVAREMRNLFKGNR